MSKLSVQADLTIEVDGDVARLTADGSALTLTADHPERVWASVLASALPAGVGELDGPRAVGRVADQLADAGLTLQVTGPRGTVADLGYGVRSRAGRVITGSAAVRPGAPGALVALVSRRSWAVAAGVAIVLGGLAAVVRSRTRS
jgi:hypothetical protein